MSLTSLHLSAKKLGDLGENMAAHFFEQQGFFIIDRQKLTPYGEIDIIVRQTDPLVWIFVEVKTRQTAMWGSPSEAVTWKKKARLQRAILWYTSSFQLESDNVRFDIVSIYGDLVVPTIWHLEHFSEVDIINLY